LLRPPGTSRAVAVVGNYKRISNPIAVLNFLWYTQLTCVVDGQKSAFIRADPRPFLFVGNNALSALWIDLSVD